MNRMDKNRLLERASPIIKKIAENRKNQKFAYYEGVDVAQEVWVFCLEALERYDPSKSPDVPLDKQIEHFLNRHVTNRLKNLMRDRYFRPEAEEVRSGYAKARMNLVNALPLDNCDINKNDTILGSANKSYDPVSFAIVKEMKEHVLSELPEDLVDPFIALLGGNRVKKSLEMALQEAVAEILQEWDDG